MSREELGSAPVEVPSAPERPARLVTTAVPAPPDTAENRRPAGMVADVVPPRPTLRARRRSAVRMLRRRPAAVGMVVALLLGLAAGWGGSRWWAGTADDAHGRRGSAVAATVTGVRSTLATHERTSLELTVRVTNLEGAPVVVTGAAPSFTAARIDAVLPEDLTLDAQSWYDLVVRVSVDCQSPRPLRLPALQVQWPGLGTDPVDVTGDGNPLVHACQGPLGPLVLAKESVAVDDGRLRLALFSPTGRTSLVQGILAGGVRLSGGVQPATVEGEPHTFWLDPPGTCPAEWLRAGLPQSLELDLDVGAPATLTLDVGRPLVLWLLSGACRPGGTT